jgi:glycosyltransferase involved in cell wall biosynthesis
MGQLDERSLLYRSLQRLERFLYQRADAVVALAPGVVRVLVEDEGLAAERVHLIPNGADPTDFDCPSPSERDREDLGLSGFVVAYTGAHGPANGLDVVLDAAETLRTELPEVRFLLVGDGTSKPALLADADRRQLTNIEFRDAVPKSAMPRLLHAVDAGLHVLADVDLFRYGVSPNKLFDYMAAGLPVITNTGGEVAELVNDAGAGLACPPDGLAEAIREVVQATSAQRAHWGSAGRNWVGSTRSRAAMANRLTTLLNAVST